MSLDKQYLRDCAKMVDDRLPDNHGFILLTFPFGEHAPGSARVTYTSNANRQDAIAAMKEFIIQAGGGEDWMRHIE